jgi:hypothetical protein
MSYIVTPFEVSSKALAHPVKCRFVHLLSGIATRHSDTIDCFFQVDGQKVTVAISCPAIRALQEREAWQLSDQRLAEIAARFLRRTLEQGYHPAPAELFVDEAELRRLAQEVSVLGTPDAQS